MKITKLILAALLVSITVHAEIPARSETEIGAQMAGLLLAGSGEIEHRTETCFEKLNLAETLLARDALLSAVASPQREVVFQIMIHHWARLAGPAAYAFAGNQQVVPKQVALSQAIIGWAATDPAAAWDQLMIQSNRGADRRFNIISTLDAVAENNLELALKFFEDLLPDRACLDCCALHLIVAAARTGAFEKIREAISRMPAGPTRDALRDEYWSYLGRYLTDWGLAKLKGLTDADEARAAEAAFCTGWAFQRFDDCMEYILRQSSSARRDELILAVVQAWARFAVHEDVVKVIHSLPADLGDRARLGLTNSLASLDPRATLDWVGVSTPSSIRTEALHWAMWRWAHIEPEVAHEYIQASTDKDSRAILLWSYLFAKLDNQTLSFPELAEIDGRYDLDWRIRLFTRIAVNLADPSKNNGGKYDLSAFEQLVAGRQDFSVEAQAKILQPFKKK